jgi:two-component system KDP operon response regulator KdpE
MTERQAENRPLILVADQQREITRLVSLALGRGGFRVIAAADEAAALERISESNPDVVLLDATLPGMKDYAMLRELRSARRVPVILLSTHGGASQISEGLDAGADDYIVKPFHPGELAARVRAVMRRARQGMLSGRRRVAKALVDFSRRAATVDGQLVRMSRTEWLLLELFLSHQGRILLHEEILRHIRGPEYRDEIGYLRLWIGQLRRKLGVSPWEEGPIRTVQGLGYAYDPDGALPRMRSRRPRPAETDEPARSDSRAGDPATGYRKVPVGPGRTSATRTTSASRSG